MTPSRDGARTPGLRETSARPGVLLTEISLLAMALIWGVNFSVVKYGTQVLAPLAFNGIRVALAAVTLSLIVTLSRGGWPARRDTLALVGLGMLGNGLYQVLFVEGIARTRAGDAALVIAASPALIALLGRLRGIERVSRGAMGGIALSIAGIALVVYGAGGTMGRSSLVGNGLVLLGSLCWSVYTVLLKPYTHRVDGIRLSAATMVGGAIPLLALAAPDMAGARWGEVTALGWGAVAYSGLLALVVAYLFWYRGVRVLGPTRTAMFANLQPLIAVLVAWLTLGEVPTLWQGVGAVAIMTGLFLTRS